MKVSAKACGRSARSICRERSVAAGGSPRYRSKECRFLLSGIQVVPRYFIALRSCDLRAFLFETEAIVWSILPEETAISSDPLQREIVASSKKGLEKLT